MFLQVSVHGGRGWWWYPSMPCRFLGPHPRGKFRGIWPGGFSRPIPKGGVEGDLTGGGVRSGGCLLGGYLFQGVPALGGSAPRGACFRGSAPGGVYSWGGVWRPPVMATAAGGMHPTGMHSCFLFFSFFLLENREILDPPL